MTDGRAVVTVSNTGPLIAPDEVDRLEGAGLLGGGLFSRTAPAAVHRAALDNWPNGMAPGWRAQG
jgi:hypothetical protein